MNRERARLLATVAVLVAVVSPMLRDRDSFPLSTYPVYADVRPREATFVTAVGLGFDGSEHRLPMAVIARTDDPLIAEQRLRSAVAEGRAASACVSIATRAPDDILTVLVVSDRYDVVDAAAGRPAQLARVIEARCRVGR